MIRGVATGVCSYLCGFLLGFSLACGGKGALCQKATGTGAPPSNTPICEVRR